MFDFKKSFSSIFSNNKRNEHPQEESLALLPPKTSVIDLTGCSPVKEEDIPQDITIALQKAKQARKIAINLSDNGYPVFVHTRKDLQYTAVEYKGISQKNGKHVYEIEWVPVILNLHQYQKGHYNFKNELPLVVFHENDTWYFKVSWPNGLFYSKIELDLVSI